MKYKILAAKFPNAISLPKTTVGRESSVIAAHYGVDIWYEKKHGLVDLVCISWPERKQPPLTWPLVRVDDIVWAEMEEEALESVMLPPPPAEPTPVPKARSRKVASA